MTYEVEVIAVNSDYKAGTPNTNGGTISRDETINANPATLIIPTGSIEVKYKEGEINFTVPVGIHVIKTDYKQLNSNSSIKYVGVTPGTIHRICTPDRYCQPPTWHSLAHRAGAVLSPYQKQYPLQSVPAVPWS